MEEYRKTHGIYRLGELIYVFGGRFEKRNLSSIECYDRVSEEWTTKSPMNELIRYATVARIGIKLYILGHVQNEQARIVQYNTDTDICKSLSYNLEPSTYKLISRDRSLLLVSPSKTVILEDMKNAKIGEQRGIEAISDMRPERSG
jgi:hypothetical protein